MIRYPNRKVKRKKKNLKKMLHNHLYNLLHQLVQENKSLWRIAKMYKKDSKGCKACQNFWKKLEEDKERQVEELKSLLSSHLLK